MRTYFHLLVALALPSSAIAGVIVVDKTGAGDYTSLPAALNAASSADVLLMRRGDYTVAIPWPPAPIVLPDMDLSIVADEGAVVRLGNELQLTGLSASHRIVISGLALENTFNGGGAALRLEACLGAVRVQDCTLTSYGDRAMTVTGCNDVVLTRLSMSAGHGPSTSQGDGGHGREGLRLIASDVAAYDCLFGGGNGEDAFWGGLFCGAEGGNGGPGAAILSGSYLYAMGCEFQGGNGGLGFCEGPDGVGAVGLLVLSSEAQLAQPIFSPGSSPSGVVAPPNSGSLIVNLNQIRRELQGPVVVREGQAFIWTFIGRPGDRIFLPKSPDTTLRWLAPLGALTLASPISVGGQLGVIGPGTSLQVSTHAPTLPSGVDVELTHQQFFALKADGKRLLGTAHGQFVLDSSF